MTRQEQKRKKIREENAYLSEKGLTRAKFSTSPIDARVENRARLNRNDYPVYGIRRDGNEWVLTGLSVVDYHVRTSGDTKVRGKYVPSPPHGDPRPEHGIEIERFDTKSEAMRHVRADASERVEPGEYLVYPKHDPKTLRENVARDAFTEFKRSVGAKVWE